MFPIFGIFALIVSLGVVSVEGQSSTDNTQKNPTEQVKK